MNPRIRELAEQARQYAREQMSHANKPYLFSADVFEEKFALLIVEECISMCRTAVGNADYNTGRLHCLENIKEHFGVV